MAINEGQQSRVQDIVSAAQMWAAEHTSLSWERLMQIRTREAVYIRAAMVERLTDLGLSLKQMGKELGRGHDTILHTQRMLTAYRQDEDYRILCRQYANYLPNYIQPTKEDTRLMFNATIMGTIGRDAEPRSIREKQYSSFSVAVEGRKDEGTTWVKVLAYAGKATKFYRKGARIVATGRLTIGVYNDKPDVTLWADNIEVAQFAKDEQQEAAPVYASRPEAYAPQQEDLPF